MGCINSKKAFARDSPEYVRPVSATSDKRSSVAEPPSRVQYGVLTSETKEEQQPLEDRIQDGKRFKKNSSRGTGSLRISHRFVEAEQNAAGWPPWLTSVAGEAIEGWLPVRADSFEKLDKVGNVHSYFFQHFFGGLNCFSVVITKLDFSFRSSYLQVI